MESGLEVSISTDPEILTQPDENKYCIGGRRPHRPALQSDQHQDQSQAKSRGQFKGTWALTVVALLLLAVALGTGLGAGLAAQHKPGPSV